MASKKKPDGSDDDSYEALIRHVPELLGFSARLEQELTKRYPDGFTQTAIAAITGLSQPTVHNLLKKPDRVGLRLSTVLRLAKECDISLDVLLLGKPNPWKIAAQLARRKAAKEVSEKPPAPPPPPPAKQRKKKPPPT